MTLSLRCCLMLLLVLLLPGCVSLSPATSPAASQPAPDPSLSPSATPTPALTSSPASDPSACLPDPVVVPTVPAFIPDYAQLDPSTNLHITGGYQLIDLAAYRLKVTGNVAQELSLTYDELRCLPRIEATPALICPGYFEDYAAWAGVPLSYLLELAGIQADAELVYLVAADDYRAILSPEMALAPENFLAYEWEGQPLPILHGFPLRAVIPASEGNKWVKWLVEIKVR